MAFKKSGQERARLRENRMRLLQCALEVLAVHGIEGTTPGSIARKFGMSQGSLYTYFRSITDILARAVVVARDEHIKAMHAGAAANIDAPMAGALLALYRAFNERPRLAHYLCGRPLYSASVIDELEDAIGANCPSMASKERHIMASVVLGALCGAAGHGEGTAKTARAVISAALRAIGWTDRGVERDMENLKVSA